MAKQFSGNTNHLKTNGFTSEAPYATESTYAAAETSPQTVLKPMAERQLAPWEKHDVPKPRGKAPYSPGQTPRTPGKAKAPFATAEEEQEEVEQEKTPPRQIKAPWDRDETVFLGKGGPRKLGSSLAPYAVE
eukprot:TRINITY_DN18356_c0_g1_i1.p2 TRINITY_DN18356_c0_g1~~TRINITY_DN18356_c0_g1_i1.p2  ORF type:complete len:132 (-),score=20.10 TRINITY_DN18356_c0_g1_i1:530-925(-)